MAEEGGCEVEGGWVMEEGDWVVDDDEVWVVE